MCDKLQRGRPDAVPELAGEDPLSGWFVLFSGQVQGPAARRRLRPVVGDVRPGIGWEAVPLGGPTASPSRVAVVSSSLVSSLGCWVARCRLLCTALRLGGVSGVVFVRVGRTLSLGGRAGRLRRGGNSPVAVLRLSGGVALGGIQEQRSGLR